MTDGRYGCSWNPSVAPWSHATGARFDDDVQQTFAAVTAVEHTQWVAVTMRSLEAEAVPLQAYL